MRNDRSQADTFHRYHQAAPARLIEFAGFSMPVRLRRDVREHLVVRKAAGLFDISHMGEFHVSGPKAADFLDRCDEPRGRARGRPGALLADVPANGGIVDDLLVYRARDFYLVVVNAANLAKDFDWLKEHAPDDVTLQDWSDNTGAAAVQRAALGPGAARPRAGIRARAALLPLRRDHDLRVPAIVSRTGYTGEDGFEIYFDRGTPRRCGRGWSPRGARSGSSRSGLGARDTLRLEVGFMLYGNDIDDSTSPFEAGLSWTVKMAKPDFMGKTSLERQKAQGLLRRLVGSSSTAPRAAHNMVIVSEGRPVGTVTSGTFSPSLERPIGMGYVETALANRAPWSRSWWARRISRHAS